MQVVHDAENDFASVLFLPSAGIREFAVFEQVVEGYSRRHVVSYNFENAANHIAFNHDDKRSIVLIDNVTQGYRRSNNLFFDASDFHERTFVGESDESSAVSVE